MTKKTTVMVSGGFDPLHLGHLIHFQEAKKLGDKLLVVIDPDDYVIKKKGAVFMPIEQRAEIIKELRCVDEVVIGSVAEAILSVKPDILAKGGDRVSLEDFDDQEKEAIRKVKPKLVFGVGGGKITSSSELLKRWVEIKSNK